MTKWYVIHGMSGSELDIKKVLEDTGFPALVPRRKMKERIGGVWQEKERLLFPGYVFVKAEMTSQDYYRISGIGGVITLLRGASAAPEPVKDEEMQQVFRFTRDGDLVGISNILMDGDDVQVVSGPLEGFEGNIIKVDKRRFRAKVRFTLAGQEKEVELGVNVLNKV